MRAHVCALFYVTQLKREAGDIKMTMQAYSMVTTCRL